MKKYVPHVFPAGFPDSPECFSDILSPNDVHRLENMDLIPAEEGGDDYYLNGGYVKLKDAGVAQQNKAAAAQQNQPKETQPDPEEEPDSDNRLSESKPRKNGRRTR